MKKYNTILGCLSAFLLVAAWAGTAYSAQQKERGAKAGGGSGASFTTEEVKVPSEDVMIAGTLVMPRAAADVRHPAVVIVAPVHGERDGIKVGTAFHNSYKQLAEHFAGIGIASVRFDRRCTGASTCGETNSLVAGAEDGLSLVKFLASRKDVDKARIWVLGHGDGSVIAANVAAHDGVAGLILLEGIGRNGLKFMRDWERQKTVEARMSPAQAETYLAEFEKLVAFMIRGERSGNEKPTFTDELTAPLLKVPQFTYSWLIDDPLLVYPHTHGPVLIIHGQKDRRIPVKEGIFIQEAYDVDGHKAGVERHVLPNMDFFLKTNAKAASPEVDLDVNRPIDPDLLKILTEWIEKRAK